MAQLTAQGFEARTLEQIIEQISGNLKATFGTSFDTSPESPDGQLIGIFAEQLWLSEQAAQAVYQSSDPDRASGESLEYVCDYNGVYRRLETPTTASVTFTGTAGTVVPQGVLVSTEDGLEFATDHSEVVGTPVSVTCTKLGRFEVAVNEINQIKTPIAGVTSVTNATGGTTGFDRESDASMRNRRAFSVVDRGSNTIESIYAELFRQGAEFVSIVQNVEDTPVHTIPPKSFVTIVRGLEDEVIFKAIFDNKPAGIKAYGTTEGQVKDSKDYSHAIGFSRPKDIPIDVKVSYKRIKGSPTDVEAYMKQGISYDLNTYQKIGQDVVWSDVMAAAIYSSNGGPSISKPSADNVATSIRSVEIKRKDSGIFGNSDIALSFDEKAVVGTITFTEIPV